MPVKITGISCTLNFSADRCTWIFNGKTENNRDSLRMQKRKHPRNQLIIRVFVILCELLGGEDGIRTRLRYISESQILSILSSLAGNDLETKRSFFVRTCLKEPLLHCKYKYSFLFTQIILIFLYTKVFDWLLFGGSCLI